MRRPARFLSVTPNENPPAEGCAPNPPAEGCDPNPNADADDGWAEPKLVNGEEFGGWLSNTPADVGCDPNEKTPLAALPPPAVPNTLAVPNWAGAAEPPKE